MGRLFMNLYRLSGKSVNNLNYVDIWKYFEERALRNPHDHWFVIGQ